MALDGSVNELDRGHGPLLPSGHPPTSRQEQDAETDGFSDLDDAGPRLRDMDSDDSVYEPGSPNEDEDGNPLPSDPDLASDPAPEADAVARGIKPDPDDEDGLSLAHLPVSCHRRASSSRTHTGPSPPLSPLPFPSRSKRPPGAPDMDLRPLKRKRGLLNREYLELLNMDIEDAAARYVPHDEPDFPPSQIGLTTWSSAEKDVFFNALSRLGRDAIPAVSQSIRSKSELEVQQYLRLLDDAVAARKQRRELAPLLPAAFPAAVEVSPQCCRLLEDAADALALKQERYEEEREELRWGDSWLITHDNYADIEAASPHDLPSVQMFKVSAWLRLSARLFMNASPPENNWQHVSDDGCYPSIRATALEDFRSLAVSITKRLVSAAIYVGSSRIRAKQALRPSMSPVVRREDVEAAALSLGLETNSRRFWSACARRLRLAVYDDGADPGGYGEPEIMSYNDVEAALGASSPPEPQPGDGGDDVPRRPDSEDEAENADGGDDDHDSDADGLSTSPAGDDPGSPGQPASDEEAVRCEARELLYYTAFDHPRTTHTRQAVEARVRAELRHVAHADAADADASRSEERRLWALLGRDPPRGLLPDPGPLLPPPPPPPPPPRHAVYAVDELGPGGGNWREGLRYAGEWERPVGEEGAGGVVARE